VNFELLLTAVMLVVGAVVLVLLWPGGRRGRAGTAVPVRPFRSVVVQDERHLDLATDWVHTRLRSSRGLERSEVRRALGWVGEFVRRNARPLNGEGRALGISDSTGWLVAPNMFDVVAHLRTRAGAAGLHIDTECAWELCSLHDDFLASRTD